MKEWLEDRLYDIVDIYYKVRYLFRRIKRIVQWIPIIWKDFDNDHTDLYTVLSFKLTRLYRNMDKWLDPDDSQNKMTLKSCRLAAYLAERLGNGNYEYIKFKPLGEFAKMDLCSQAFNEANRWESRDLKIFHNLMNKYSRFWWV
jgi:hypothetical protein